MFEAVKTHRLFQLVRFSSELAPRTARSVRSPASLPPSGPERSLRGDLPRDRRVQGPDLRQGLHRCYIGRRVPCPRGPYVWAPRPQPSWHVSPCRGQCNVKHDPPADPDPPAIREEVLGPSCPHSPMPPLLGGRAPAKLPDSSAPVLHSWSRGRGTVCGFVLRPRYGR